MTTIAAATPPPANPHAHPNPKDDTIKRRLLRYGVAPTPKILHAIRKKENQKALRRTKKRTLSQESENPTTKLEEEDEEVAFFRRASREYRALRASGMPWEKLGNSDLRENWDLGDGEVVGRLKGESLKELRGVLEERSGVKYRWLLEDDVEEEIGDGEVEVERSKVGSWNKAVGDEKGRIKWLVHRLTSTNLNIEDWKFPRLMKQSGLHFSEHVLLKVLAKLGSRGNWKQALAVVEWVYKEKDYRFTKSRFVYTKLLAVLGKARKPNEALRIFDIMRKDCHIYPDMAAYHSISVTLGQAGLVKKVIDLIECMREKPPKKLRNMKRKDWDPRLEPDIVIYNAVLNACVPTRQWKGVSWVFKQMRRSGLQPTGATYGLAMEVMLESGKYDVVHKLFLTMQRNGLALSSLTYKVLVRTFWKEGNVDGAVAAVRDMEQRGIVGAGSVYYELACCLCYHGRWKEAITEISNLRKGSLTKPIEVALTGMILSSLDGGHVHDCISIFKFMKDHCHPNIGSVNAMLKVYRHADMFGKAKELFETAKAIDSDFKNSHNVASLTPDAYSYNTMLEVSAASQQWEYFEHLYKEMIISGFSLDQNKHAHLLVEASRGGKWHLLEHAFDTILEAGDIPFKSIFTEMLCQTVSRENYEKVIPLANMMAYASLQVSDTQWTSVFEKNQDRITKDKLEKLLKHLEKSNTVSEIPVSSLIASLQYICRLRKSLPRFASQHELPEDELGAGSPKLLKQKTVAHSVAIPDVPDRIRVADESDADSDNEIFEENVTDMPGEQRASHARDLQLKPEIFDDSDSETSVIDDVIESLTGGMESCSLDLPSASDILESWKQKRIKDGVFLL